MKWVITGILAVSAAAASANGYMTFSFSSGGPPVALDQSKGQSDMPVDMAQANDPAGQPGYTTFSNDVNKTDGGFYTTPGGCNAPRRPEIEHYDIAGAASLRFLESAYIHQVAASLEAADGKCTCELRFPSWDAAFKDMEERFMSLPDDESSDWVWDYALTDRTRLSREVDKICKAQGIY